MGEFTDIVAVSQMTPGPIGINSATYVGYTAVVNAGGAHWMGILGSATATFAVVLPSFILMIIIAKFLMKYKTHSAVENTFQGLRPAVVGLLAAAALLLMNEENFGTVSETPWQFWISVGIFCCAMIAHRIYRTNPIAIILVCGITGMLLF